MSYRYIRNDRAIRKILFGFVPFFVYFILQMTFIIIANGNKDVYSQNIQYVFMYAFFILIAASFMISLVSKKGYSKDEVVKFLIAVGIIQFICVISSLLVPAVKEFFTSLIIRNSRSEAVVNATISYGGYRSYGFADNLFDQFGYIISLIIVITFAYGLFEKKKRILLLSLFFLVMPMLNARSGLLLSLIGICIVSLYYIFINGFNKTYKIIGIAILLVLLASVLLNNISLDKLEWLTDGYNEIFNLVTQGDKSGKTINALFNEDMVWPDDLLFGAGGSPNNFGYVGIDMGYVRLIWMFGGIGTVLLFGGYIRMF